ncbi:MAG: EAL domain-containing protein [Nitrosomonadales bacterium]|nr:EAL domain-containing protein [Nitrosomonadales bacterium]
MIRFLPTAPEASLLYAGSYSPALVIASVLIAILAAYAALSVSPRIAQAGSGLQRAVWATIGSLAMGVGVWAMHFIGMLALNLSCPVRYDPVITLVSMLPGLLASGVALGIIGKQNTGKGPLLAGSVLLAAGIGAMHYTGMAAMRLNGQVYYDPAWFGLSVFVAVPLAYVALTIKGSTHFLSRGRDLFSAAIMGGAVSVMHYTAMSAAYFVRGDAADIPAPAFGANDLAVAVAAVTSLLAAATIAAATAYRNREMAYSLGESEERFRTLATATSQIVWMTDARGEATGDVPAWRAYTGQSFEEIKGWGWAAALHPDDVERTVAIWKQAVETRSIYKTEYRLRRHDGVYGYFGVRGAPVRNTDGSVREWVGTCTDITERMLVEQTLRFVSQHGWAEAGAEAEFIPTLARYLAGLLEVDFVFVGRLSGEDTVTVMALYGKGEISGNFIYSLRGTPCENVVGQTTCIYPQNIQSLFPGDQLLADMGIESYGGIPLRDSKGDALGLLAVMHSAPLENVERVRSQLQLVSARVAAELERKAFEDSLRLSSLVLQNSSEGMVVTDENNLIVAVNPAFTRITGYSFEEVQGKDPKILRSGHHDKSFYQAMWQELNSAGQWQGEIWDKRKNGEVHAKRLIINTIRNGAGGVFCRVALFSDITEKKQSEELIWRQANFDALTGLPNRRMFRDRLEQETVKSDRADLPLALLLIDLDEFKEVNDTLGHDMGDILLKQAALRITGCVRATDTVARLGGDEFAVVLSQLADASHAEDSAQKILAGLAEPFRLGSEIVYVSASIGISLYPSDAADIESLMKEADQAMYVAKNQGRNRFSYFTPALQEAAQKRLRLTNDLRGALASGQFHVYYQPIVELATGDIRKAEALIRWRHPERGMVSPAEFIPLAEKTGLIVEIGYWVFREAAHQVSRWQARFGEAFQISVNRSPVQFREHLVQNHLPCLAYLDELQLSGQSMVFEITEGLLLDNSPGVADSLFKFRDAGIQVSLDDFGTGYSSLSYLKKFDIDYLKIDRSFVEHLENDASNMALCEAIIVMAHKLGLKVIAEGVETAEQRKLLADAGCDYGQGYLFSRPVPPEEFERLLAGEWRKVWRLT